MKELKEELKHFEASSQTKAMEDLENRLQLAVEENERQMRKVQSRGNRILQLEAESKKQNFCFCRVLDDCTVLLCFSIVLDDCTVLLYLSRE